MVRSFIWRRSSVMPLLFCFSMCMLTAAYGMVQYAFGDVGTTSLQLVDGSKNSTIQTAQMKLAGNRSATPHDPQAKPPVKLRVTPPGNKHTFSPVIQVSPDDAEKLKKLFEQMNSGQKTGPRK
jgi:hypothetical protein